MADMSNWKTGGLELLLQRALNGDETELPAADGGILLFFLLFLAYSMLRTVRKMMGIAGGVWNFQ